jgi:hypothetical protein
MNDSEQKVLKYSIFITTTYKKEYKKFSNQEIKKKAIREIVEILMFEGTEGIPQKNLPHLLTGNFKGCWECHVQPDLLLIWQEDIENKAIILQRLGSHSELFGKNKR